MRDCCDNPNKCCRERDIAILERDELREAAPDADIAYWQDRCLDHATALDTERIRSTTYKNTLVDLLIFARGNPIVLEKIHAALDWMPETNG